MMKLIVTTIGMGKTTYVKSLKDNYEVGSAPFVDLDFRMPFKDVTDKIRSAITGVINAFAKSGIAEVCFINPEFLNADALSVGACDVIFLYPKDVEAVKTRVKERDGDETFANMIDDQIEVMRNMHKSHVISHSTREEVADGVNEFLSSDTTTEGTPEESSNQEKLTDSTEEKIAEEELEEGESTDGEEQATRTMP